MHITSFRAEDYLVGKTVAYFMNFTLRALIPPNGWIQIRVPANLTVAEGSIQIVTGLDSAKTRSIKTSGNELQLRLGESATLPGSVQIRICNITNRPDNLEAESGEVDISTYNAESVEIETGRLTFAATFVCAASCRTCNQTATNCIECAESYSMQSGMCKRDCGSGFASVGPECRACPPNCLECDSSSCLRCREGFTLTEQENCDVIQERRSVLVSMQRLPFLALYMAFVVLYVLLKKFLCRKQRLQTWIVVHVFWSWIETIVLFSLLAIFLVNAAYIFFVLALAQLAGFIVVQR